MELATRTWAILWKDLLIEVRTKGSFNAMIFFAALVLFIFAFAVGPDPALLQDLAGGLLWVGITFTGVISLSRTFHSEELSGGLEGLELYPGEIRAVYLGKLLGNVILLLAVEAILFPLGAVLFQLDIVTHRSGNGEDHCSAHPSRQETQKRMGDDNRRSTRWRDIHPICKGTSDSGDRL